MAPPVRRLFTLVTLFVLLSIAAVGSAQPVRGTAGEAPGILYATISSTGPLTQLLLGMDASAQIGHSGETTYELYPSSSVPADFGSFLVVDGELYAPDFANHGGTATGALGPYTPFTPVAQSRVVGTGSAEDPFRVRTVVDVGTTGLRLAQIDSYVEGEESYRTDLLLSNSGSTPRDVILYRAMDCYMGGSDNGYGMVNSAVGSAGCTRTAHNAPADRVHLLLPITPGNHYYEGHSSAVWATIGAGQPFDDSCDCATLQDNGIGISWEMVVPAGGSVDYSHLTLFSRLGRLPLSITKTADAPATVPEGINGYTITFANPNPVPVDVYSIHDELPLGFSYVPGSTSGLTTSDPAIELQTLAWNSGVGFTIPAGSTRSLHFDVIVSMHGGRYYNEVSANAEPYTVGPTGPTAPILIERPTAVTLAALGSAPRFAPLAALAVASLAAAGCAALVRRRARARVE